MNTLKSLTIITLALTLSACGNRFQYADWTPTDTTTTDITSTTDAQGNEAELLSAFFGRDSDLPILSRFFICPDAHNEDGMPVIFSHELDPASIQAGDFRVTSASGKVGSVSCAALSPANDIGEWRTVLLTGDYGSIDDQPMEVEIIGNVLSKDHSINFKGTTVKPIPLEAGPSITMAEVVPQEQWELGKTATRLPFGGSSGCPEGTKQIIRVVWEGGITKPGKVGSIRPSGGEVDDKERQLYTITIEEEPKTITAYALGDLGDGDNNHNLCLDRVVTPTSVSFPAGYVTDPRNDLNPDTKVGVRQVTY